jgi:hypothetical protein
VVKPRKKAADRGIKPQTSVVQVSRQDWFLLRSVALKRSLKKGSRVTLVEVLSEVIQRERKVLEKELAG